MKDLKNLKNKGNFLHFQTTNILSNIILSLTSNNP